MASTGAGGAQRLQRPQRHRLDGPVSGQRVVDVGHQPGHARPRVRLQLRQGPRRKGLIDINYIAAAAADH
jgi:hypothetical protein